MNFFLKSKNIDYVDISIKLIYNFIFCRWYSSNKLTVCVNKYIISNALKNAIPDWNSNPEYSGWKTLSYTTEVNIGTLYTERCSLSKIKRVYSRPMNKHSLYLRNVLKTYLNTIKY